jgi:hypothetical protein
LNQTNSTSRNVGIIAGCPATGWAAGGFLLGALLLAVPARAQDAGICPATGFDICFPNIATAAPSVACEPVDAGTADVNACLADVCSGKANEPEPGFFSFCCAQGGAVQYDDFCVLVTQTACPAVATLCAGRCPPVELLTSGITLAAPPEACLADYPAAITSVCSEDPFCCSTSWDVLCSSAAVAAGAPLAVVAAPSVAAPSVAVAPNVAPSVAVAPNAAP